MRAGSFLTAIKIAVLVVIVGMYTLSASVKQLSAQQAPEDPRIEPALRESRKMAGELTDKVRKLLLEELKKGGYVEALRVCSEVAQDITSQFNKRAGYNIRRISLGYRNLKDIPDEYERHKLELFDRLNDENKLATEYFEVVKERDVEYLRYLKPLKTAEMCTVCHGQIDEIPHRVMSILQEAYPDDRAIGYRLDDVRGAVSVKVALQPRPIH
ncbi:MAG: DUF3365 domain-containing protein [Acidobacteria bacterium]|nr:DUF3365 domain-containing protein [Acidobacteriota bacterium]